MVIRILLDNVISSSTAKDYSTYIDLGWSYTGFTTNGNTTYPELNGDGFAFDNKGRILLDGTVTMSQSKNTDTYTPIGWDFNRVWVNRNSFELPTLIYRSAVDLGVPFTHNMNYFYVVPHIEGTMKFKEMTWKSRGAFFSFPSPPSNGVLNQEVTYSIPDQDLEFTIDNKIDGIVDVVWFASGVRDIDGAGGFGSYNEQRTRTIKVVNVASATVNFYFTQAKYIPKTNYKAQVSTPDGIVDVLVRPRSPNSIRFAVMPSVILTLPLVEPDVEGSTAIRVMTEHGIKTLHAYIEFEHSETLTD